MNSLSVPLVSVDSLRLPPQRLLPLAASGSPVLMLDEIVIEQMQELLSRFNVQLELIGEDQVIPGSYWGDSEAGLIGNSLYARLDTPVHSILHEACHYICMDDLRRAALHRDAGGDVDEENAVCYLQIVLSDYIDGFDRIQMQNDMDAWGYTFRLGSAHAWFMQEAEDAQRWLIEAGILDSSDVPTWHARR
jgi:hypothetical protein